MSRQKKPKRGRPCAVGKPRAVTFKIRATAQERAALQKKARSCGLPLSDFIREAAAEYQGKREEKSEGR